MAFGNMSNQTILLSLEPAANLAAERNTMSTISIFGMAWVILMLGVVVNGLFCHISPGLMLRLQSNPWTTQFSWMFGVEAQNFQSLSFVVYHQSFMGQVTHYPTLFVDFFAWTYIAHYCLGATACKVMLVLVVCQSASSRFIPLVAATMLSTAAALTLSTYAMAMPVSTQLLLFQYSQLAILFGALARPLGHLFEDTVPPMPTDLSEYTLKFHSLLLTIDNIGRYLPRLPHAICAETSAGMPLRLYIPMLNVLIGHLFKGTDNIRPNGLESLEATNSRAKKVLQKGWLEGLPSAANLFFPALRRETPPTSLPKTTLKPLWKWLLIMECVSLLAVSAGWLVAPNGLITGYRWSEEAMQCHTMGNCSHVTINALSSGANGAHALAIAAALVVISAFAYVLLRMLSASNLDVRAFCFVLEGFTLCGLLLLLAVLTLQAKGLRINFGSQQEAESPGVTALYSASVLLLVCSAINFIFLLVEVPHMQERACQTTELKDQHLSEGEDGVDSLPCGLVSSRRKYTSPRRTTSAPRTRASLKL